jgi:hypothetical protein
MTHPFQIGNTYTNRKGDYQVVSLDERQDKMVIRYVDNGKNHETTITDSERIWENMNWEK